MRFRGDKNQCEINIGKCLVGWTLAYLKNY